MRIKIKDKNNFMKLFNDIYIKHQISDINAISIDSRNLEDNDIFFALKGEKYDGNNFVNRVIKNKNVKCFTSKKINNSKIIYCNSVRKEITKIASLWRKKTKAKIIAITGSNGKTTLKELVYHILNKKYRCSKSIGNFNSITGLPIAFLNSKLDDDYCILELGANKPNEIKNLCNIIKPNFGIITNISNAHIGNFKSISELIETKASIFKSNEKSFINLNNKYTSLINVENPITFGDSKQADFHAKLKTKKENSISVNKEIFNIPENLTHLKDIIIAAFSITKTLNIDLNTFQKSIEEFEMPEGRGKTIKVNENYIIDDSYNANPESMKLGLNRFSNMKIKNNKIVIIADMLELGKSGTSEHKKIGQLINKCKFNIIFTYGDLMKIAFNEINGEKKQKFHYTDIKKLKKKIKAIIKPGDYIFLKGSRSMSLEKIYN
tara:strand:- start:1389 stop:2696 length:1308 start_codon:yes stop_codon:yes gene_type:complete